MPILVDRRGFLGSAMGVAVSAVMGATLTARMGAQITPNVKRVRWALLSDTHCPEDPTDTYRGFRPAENLTTAVKQVLSASFDRYLVNGDLARKQGLPGDYKRFADATGPLADKTPLALLLGNHDDRANAEAAFASTAGAKEPVESKWVSVLETGPLRMVLLDSLYQTNQSAGLLGKAQRDWLNTFLQAHTDKPTVVFVHHTLDDADGSMLDSDRFLRIVRAQRHVKAVFYGHSHVYKYDEQDGLHLVNLPAVGYNFADDQPVGWIEADLSAKDAQLTLHAFAGTRTQDNQLRKLDWRS